MEDPNQVALKSNNFVAKKRVFLKNLEISFEHIKSQFSCSIIDRNAGNNAKSPSDFCVKLPIIECEDVKSGFSDEKLEKFRKNELILKGILDPGIFEGNGVFFDFSSSFLVLEKGSKDIEVGVFPLEGDLSGNASKILFLLCLQRQENLATFSKPECYLLKRGMFRLPFVEPVDYLLLSQEKSERVGFLPVLERSKESTSRLTEAFRLIAALIYQFVTNGFLFLEIDFNDFTVFKGKFGVRLTNPERIFFYSEQFSTLGDFPEVSGLDSWKMFIKISEEAEINRDKANFCYFLLFQAYYRWRYRGEDKGFKEWFGGSFFEKKREDPTENFLFSLFVDKNEKENNENPCYFPLTDDYDKTTSENETFQLVSPTKLTTLPQISPNSYDPAIVGDRIQISAYFRLIEIQILLLKFEESISTIKKLTSYQNLSFFDHLFLDHKLALIFLQTEEFERGLEILDRSLSETRKKFGFSSQSFIGKTALLTSFFHIQKNRFTEAIDVLEIAYSSLKKAPKSATCSQILYALGHLYREINNFELSFKCFKKVEQKCLCFWSESSQISRIFSETLGMLYIQRHEYLQAKELLENALEIYKLRLANVEKSEKYSNILNTLGFCYFELKNPEKALEFYEKSIEMKGSLFSQNYEKKGETMANLALIYFELSDFKKAIEMNLKAIEVYSQNKEKRNLANSLNNLGLAYKSSMNFEKAIESMKQALDLFESEYGKSDVLCGRTLNNIGMTYFDKGETSQAIEYCQKALEIYKIATPDKQIIARVYNNIGVLYSGNKDYEKAKEYYGKAIEIKKNTDGKNLVDIGDSLNNLANINHLQKDFDKAETLYKEILEIRSKYLGETHKATLETVRNLAECLFERKEFEEAAMFFRKLIDIKQKLESGFEKTSEKALIMSKIAICSGKVGQIVNSLMEWKCVVEIERENIAGNKKALIEYLKEYGLALRVAERYKESIEKLKEAMQILKKNKEKNEKEMKTLKEEIKKTKALMK